jgi:hypothetical protein
MLPKAHVVKAWSPGCGALGGSGTFKRWGLVRGSSATRGCAHDGDMRIPALSFLSLFPIAMR